jgi:UDP-sulfoquinovose synthase
VLHPADRGEFRVFNQFTQQFSVKELAEIVQRGGKEHGFDVRIEPIDNPRIEREDHHHNAKHTKLLDLGFQPHFLSETLVESMFGVIERHKDRVITDVILPRDRWRTGIRDALELADAGDQDPRRSRGGRSFILAVRDTTADRSAGRT